MTQPQSLRTDKYQEWSRGRGNDVWAMLCAARDGDLDKARELASHDRQLIDCEFEYRRPLYFAVLANRLPMVRYLLEEGADVTAGFGDVPLATGARERGYVELAEWMDAWLRTRFGICPEGEELAAWIRQRDTARVQAAIEASPDLVGAADGRGNQPLHWASMTRNVELIDFLLAHGADINRRRPDGARPLDLTNGDYFYRGWRDVSGEAMRPHTVVIGHLLARGADYDLTMAAYLGDCGRAKVLLDADPSVINIVPPYAAYHSGVPLRSAAGARQRVMARLLLERGADPNRAEPNAPRGGALRDAIGNHDVEMVKLLLEHGADPNGAVESSGNCLWAARGHEEIQNLIIAAGGKIPIDMLCYDGDLDPVRPLLADPAEPITEDAVHNAMSENHPELLDLIARERPEAMRGIRLGDVADGKMARQVIAYGVDPKLGNWLGITPLHRFAAKGNQDVAAVCLEHGADLNAIDDEYQSTPLGWAARAGKVDMVRWLLSHGANPAPPGQPAWAHPAEWARRRGHGQIAMILEASR